MAGLRQLGVEATQAQPALHKPGEGRTPACFDVPSHFEITVEKKKLVGSAQVRRRGAVLQHGALPLQGDTARIVSLLRLSSEGHRARLTARLTAMSTTLAQAAGRMVSFDEAVQALTAGFAEALNVELLKAELTDWERRTADRLREEKYRAQEYTFQR